MEILERLPGIFVSQVFLEIEIVSQCLPALLRLKVVVLHHSADSVFDKVKVLFEVGSDFPSIGDALLFELLESRSILLFESQVSAVTVVEARVGDLFLH